MTPADPDPPAPQTRPKRGKHAKSGEDDDEPPPAPPPAATRAEPEAEPEKPGPAWLRRRHSLVNHPGGSSLVLAAGLVTGVGLAPAVFDQLRFDVATRAADAARSAAAPWPAGSEPWFWPPWTATLALLAAVAVLGLALGGLRVPDAAIVALAVVLALTTARAAWSTLAVVNARLWELLPVCLVVLLAFGFALGAAVRWKAPTDDETGGGGGEAVAITLGSWLLVAVVLLAGSAIASSARTHALGDAGSPPQGVAGLLALRAADAGAVDDLRGSWVPQVGAAEVADDDGGTAYAATHHGWTARFDALLARGDDVGAEDLDEAWWLTLVDQPFGSAAEVEAWCSGNGLAAPGCVQRALD